MYVRRDKLCFVLVMLVMNVNISYLIKMVGYASARRFQTEYPMKLYLANQKTFPNVTMELVLNLNIITLLNKIAS